MLLKINGDRVDFTLEKEAVLSEVVRGVEDWLGSSGFFITGIHMGDRDLLDSPRGEWERTPIASVAELDFRVSDTNDVRIQHWATARAWLETLEGELGPSGPAAPLGELLDGIPETLKGFKRNPFLPPGSKTVERLGSLFEGETAQSVKAWPAERTREAVGILRECRRILAERIQEASHPRETLKARAAELRIMMGKIAEVSVLLSTGKDKRAMDTVVAFTESVQRLLSLVPFLPKDEKRERLFGELTPILRELVSAFDAKDLVLIGDLFEYEIAPRLGRLLPLLEGNE